MKKKVKMRYQKVKPTLKMIIVTVVEEMSRNGQIVMTAHALGRISQAHIAGSYETCTFDSFDEGMPLCLWRSRLKKFDIPLSDKAHYIVDIDN
ncbi:hypothetical protein QZH41_006546 [Actinostola sp. cb2023]|nr:hypothetical protein QZH41_006546 [Actinostola sp. cb2023]